MFWNERSTASESAYSSMRRRAAVQRSRFSATTIVHSMGFGSRASGSVTCRNASRSRIQWPHEACRAHGSSLSASPRSGARSHAGLAALVLVLCFACNMLGRGVGDTFIVFLLPLSGSFGWTRAQVSSVYSIYLVVTGVAAPLTGMMLDRWGPRIVYPAGVVLLGAGCLLAGHLTHLWQFQACIGILNGMAVSMLGMVPASMLISRWFRDRMSTAMGIAYAGFGTGTLLIVPLAQLLIEAYGWRETY